MLVLLHWNSVMPISVSKEFASLSMYSCTWITTVVVKKQYYSCHCFETGFWLAVNQEVLQPKLLK